MFNLDFVAFYSNFSMIVTNLLCNIVFFIPLEILKLIHYLNRKRKYVFSKVN